MTKHYFSRLHFSIRSNVKVGMLTDKAFRVYINVLTINGDGAVDRNPPETWVASQCGVSVVDLSSAMKELIDCGLLTGDGWHVKNYADRQYKNPAQARYDNKKSDKKPYGDSCSVLSDVEVDAEEEVYVSNKKKEERKTVAATAARALDAKAKEVLDYLNSVNGRQQTYLTDIISCLKREKCSVRDCQEVVDYKWGEWGSDDEMKNRVDATTLFLKKNFARYLDQSRSGDAKGSNNSESARAKRIASLKEITG